MTTNGEHYLAFLRQKARELGRPPTHREVTQDPRMPHASTISRHYGSWEEAMKQAGLDPLEEALRGLLLLCWQYGRFPTRAEIDASDLVPTYNTLRKELGGIQEMKERMCELFILNGRPDRVEYDPACVHRNKPNPDAPETHK